MSAMSEETGQALSALLAKLEAATGPDRRLDFDLWAEITRPTGWPALGEPEENRTMWFNYWKNDPLAFPRYTESLDCAMTLVPDGWLTRDVKQGTDGWHWLLAHSWRIRNGLDGVATAKAPTAALALCIAAVRARLAGQKE